MWQVTEQRQVKHYGMLEEFVTMVTETLPELLNYNQRTQLIFGLRARVRNITVHENSKHLGTTMLMIGHSERLLVSV